MLIYHYATKPKLYGATAVVAKFRLGLYMYRGSKVIETLPGQKVRQIREGKGSIFHLNRGTSALKNTRDNSVLFQHYSVFGA